MFESLKLRLRIRREEFNLIAAPILIKEYMEREAPFRTSLVREVVSLIPKANSFPSVKEQQKKVSLWK